MAQTFVNARDINDNRFVIRGPEAHHVARVLRRRVEDVLQLFDGSGRQYKGVLTRIDAAEPLVEGRIVEIFPATHSSHHVRLFQGLPKGSKFDFVLEKAVELGVDEIVPFISQKSLVKLSSPQSAAKMDRWSRLVKAAAKQCNRTSVPLVGDPCPLNELGSQITKGFSILFSEDQKSQTLREVIQNHLLNNQKNRNGTPLLPESARINIIVGPESGFADKEVSWLVGLGAHLASLGPLTLRTETAGLAALSILNYELERI